ncbi:flagellar basal body P-ring formation chaperone FlgA [Stenotrophomonas sp.]|uniref:flagellar basal body P-ring formation chaperone FlgA n=1 Tax=Stenotrophomonas sp. TaxID=69392 RepID=UPI00289DE7A0|nr:flagellar basal body P-ring formation chaperone FlgA [Stenotrophomonas sp.]
MNYLLRACLVLPVLLPTVAAAATVVPAEQLIAAALVRLQERAAQVHADWEFVPSGRPSSSTLALEGEVTIVAGEIGGQWPRNRVGVPITLKIAGSPQQTRTVWFTVHAWRDGLVYQRSQQAGDGAMDLAVRRQRVDLAAYGQDGALVDEVAALRDQRLLRSVRAGQAVLQRDFGPAPAVARNSEVALHMRQGGIALQMMATARQDGAVGDRVDVLPKGGSRWIEAAVTGRSEVTIEN